MQMNPFSPSFGAIPGTFFGRDDILDGMRDAVDNPASPFRLLFISGTRGSGKSSLLHELANIAAAAKWIVVETSGINVENDINTILGSNTKKSKSLHLMPSVSVAGAGVSAGGLSFSSDADISHSLAYSIIKRGQSLRTKNGIFIAVDEIQGVDANVVKQLCAAMQASRSQGVPIIIVFAGLPGSYEKICGWKDCSFVMRMRFERLGVLDIETAQAFMDFMFAKVPEIALTHNQKKALADYSQGHPYLMHLVGYYVYEVINTFYQPVFGATIAVSEQDLKEAKQKAFDDYRKQILQNVLSHIRQKTRKFVEVAAHSFLNGEDITVSEIFSKMDIEGESARRIRERVLQSQVVEIGDKDEVFFTIPYFAELFNKRNPVPVKKLPRTKQLLAL